ncbi:GAF domain-containing protein [Nocardia sp. NPDC004573]
MGRQRIPSAYHSGHVVRRRRTHRRPYRAVSPAGRPGRSAGRGRDRPHRQRRQSRRAGIPRAAECELGGFLFLRRPRTGRRPVPRPARVRAHRVGKGVCGTAARTRATQLVPDVHAFDGHIACDADTRSEIVVPLVRNDVLIGVFDLDSPLPERFDEIDRAGLEALAEIFLAAT